MSAPAILSPARGRVNETARHVRNPIALPLAASLAAPGRSLVRFPP